MCQMPYKKDGIGHTPYYLRRDVTYFFQQSDCATIEGQLKKMNISVYRTTAGLGCNLTVLDLHKGLIVEMAGSIKAASKQ